MSVPKPEPLPATLRLVVALSALSAHSPSQTGKRWLKSVCKLLSIDPEQLPQSIAPDAVRATADDQREDWSGEDVSRIAGILIEGSLAMEAESKESLKYTPIARAMSYATLENLGLPARELIPTAEKNLSTTLFKALKGDAEATVESTRAAHSQGWGGGLGRTLGGSLGRNRHLTALTIATGAGVIAGGVLIGVTGGLAAPAIAAVLAPLGIGGLIGGAAAPVVLGTLFGVGGGGLAGKRVRERWKGVEEFSFIEIGAGTKASQEEVDDLKAARERYRARKGKASEASAGPAEGQEKSGGDEEKDEESAAEASENSRLALEERLLDLTRDSQAPSVGSSPRVSLDSPRVSLDTGKEEKGIADVKKPPSLTVS